MTPTERAATLAYELAHGRGLSSAEVAERYGMSHSGAHRLLGRMSRVVPIYNEAGVWRLVEPMPTNTMPTNNEGGE